MNFKILDQFLSVSIREMNYIKFPKDFVYILKNNSQWFQNGEMLN